MVLWHATDEMADPAQVAGLASTRTFPLRSSFAPSYNMTINLVQHMTPAAAHRLLEQSFAQYQADRSVTGLVRGIKRGERMLAEIAAEQGDDWESVLEYARLRASIYSSSWARSAGFRVTITRPRCAAANW